MHQSRTMDKDDSAWSHDRTALISRLKMHLKGTADKGKNNSTRSMDNRSKLPKKQLKRQVNLLGARCQKCRTVQLSQFFAMLLLKSDYRGSVLSLEALEAPLHFLFQHENLVLPDLPFV